jgi:diadenosine tetraphosphate (Ap4A) HIT family hydrolase
MVVPKEHAEDVRDVNEAAPAELLQGVALPTVWQQSA